MIWSLFLQLVFLGEVLLKKRHKIRLTPFKFIIFNSYGHKYYSVFFIFIHVCDIDLLKLLSTLQTSIHFLTSSFLADVLASCFT